MKLLKYSVIGWSVLYIAGLFLIYFFQAKLVFAPAAIDSKYQFNFLSSFEEAYLDSETGNSVHYIKFKRENPKALVLYFHGNGGALDSWGHMAEKISKETNVDVWIPDYPGYGKSSKKFANSGKELIEIGEELLELIRREYPSLPIVLYGRSLGSGIASALSSDAAIDGLILETPYYTTTRLAKETFPVVPSFIFKYELDNTKIKKAKAKQILIIHSKSDKIVPYQHALDLKKDFGSKVDLVEIPGGGHNNLSTFDKYWTTLKRYMATI